MSSFETTATVDDQGQIRVAGVPFATGTKVEVTITPAPNGVQPIAATSDLTEARERMRQLFRTTTGFWNSPRIPREELYERPRLH